MKVTLESASKMSNRRYHRNGKPRWWARIGRGDDAQFVDVGHVRGDEYLCVEVELPEGAASVAIGVGPNDSHGVRETIV